MCSLKISMTARSFNWHFPASLAITFVLSAHVLVRPSSAQWFGDSIDLPGESAPRRSAEETKVLRSDRQRAVNFARSAVIKMNGGLSTYRPQSCMFSSEAKGCLVDISDSGFLFVFKGGRPGWEQLGMRPTYKTKILVSPDGRSLVRLYYNRSY